MSSAPRQRDHDRRSNLDRARMTLTVPVMVVVALVCHDPAAAATYYVGGSNCSDAAGVGSSSQPFCTITAALAAFHSAGTVFEVRAGTYPEQVSMSWSGTSGSPIVVRAASGATVQIDGADDYASTSQWTVYDGPVYRASSVTWAPVSVYLNGAPLPMGSSDPHLLADGSWRYIAGEGLYLRAGGSNPGSQPVLVGHRSYGVFMAGRSYVTIDGLTILRAQDRGIQVNGSNHIELTDNEVAMSGRMGIQLDGCSAVHVATNMLHDNGDHGLAMISGTTGCTVEHNESYRNVFPPLRSANGIYMFGATQNIVRENRLHDNQDSGLNANGASNDNAFYQNQAWSNGDHGFDHTHSSGNVLIGEVAFGNLNDGFSIEGNATSHSLYDCIGVDNGLTTNHSDLMVDDSSSVGFVSNDNVFWNSTSQSPIRYRNVRYSTISAYSAASGQDGRTVQADPKFANAPSGDFHLLAGSSAIDNANSSISGWPGTDAGGSARYDDPATTNQGLGSVQYADRGAFEFGGTLVGVSDDPILKAGGKDSGAGPNLVVLPNPARPGSAALSFRLSQRGRVTATVFTADGRRASAAVEMEMEPGDHTLPMPARDDRTPLPGGIYFCELRAPEGRAVKRLVIVP